jgi:hypothetical protein
VAHCVIANGRRGRPLNSVVRRHRFVTIDRFLEVVTAFQARVRYAIGLFDQHRGVRDLMNWRGAGLNQVGFIDKDDTMPYAFHGIGCRASTPKGPIDWDFGNAGRIDGFDLWRLETFVEANAAEFPDVAENGTLRKGFEAALAAGKIRKSESRNDHLYYRADAV